MIAIPPHVYWIGVIIGLITFAYQAIRIGYSNFLAYREILNLRDAARAHMDSWNIIFNFDNGNMEIFGDSDNVFMELSETILNDESLMEGAKRDTEQVKEILNRISDLRKRYVIAGMFSRKLGYSDASIAYTSLNLLRKGIAEDVGHNRRQRWTGGVKWRMADWRGKMFLLCMMCSKFLISKAAGPPPRLPPLPAPRPPPAPPPRHE